MYEDVVFDVKSTNPLLHAHTTLTHSMQIKDQRGITQHKNALQ
jgi:hypothetical protein